jgi:hypothetical protein
MARPGFSAGIGMRPQSLIITLAPAGPLIAFAAHTGKIRMPQKGQILGMTLNVGARGGTHVTSAIDVQKDGVTMLVATFDVDALTPGTPVDKEGSALAANAASVAKDAVISYVLTEAGGTAPTFGDCTLQIDYIPLGD